ncbi:hypothetical protein DF3PB_600013 [uncultured Defluviicoccus sp.]|uniref:Uncharacterized protein n=1 Tax=metagenome TaxID=256318 RepID=A0A380TKJ0_9ZZZZ|nr:hypothetical protein DF3PB_600013 [uncultured Defluviicoccus sp.]
MAFAAMEYLKRWAQHEDVDDLERGLGLLLTVRDRLRPQQ